MFVSVPVGNVRVTGVELDSFGLFKPPLGLTTGTLDASGPTTINVTIGNASGPSWSVPPTNLDGADGFRYDIPCDGQEFVGGTSNGSLRAYFGAFNLFLNSNSYPCPLSIFAGPAGTRGVDFGPFGFGGIEVTRKVFSPSAGGFVRYLEVLSNPTHANLPVSVKIESGLIATNIAVAPSDTNSTYAVVDSGGQVCCPPALGFVFGGIGAGLAASATRFVNQDQNIWYRWDVTVPAGKTVILMHFGIQRDVTDTNGVQTQAQALVNLTDPDALDGMSATEKSEVVNFGIP